MPQRYWRYSDMKLFLSALTKFIAGFLLCAMLIFLPAGTLAYYRGWLFIGLLFLPMLALGALMLKSSPELLKRRLDSKEKEKTQKGVVALSGIMFLAGFILAGLDFRFSWTRVPLFLTVIGAVILLISYALYAEVMRENEYLSRTVKVEEGQKVIDTGLYGIVRHPMYAVTLFLFLSIPLVLGSWISFACFLIYPAVIIVRIVNEEKVLCKELMGYDEYKKRVRYRLIPFIW